MYNVLYLLSPYQASYKIVTNCDKLIAILYLEYGRYVLNQSHSMDHVDEMILCEKCNASYKLITSDFEIITSKPIFEIKMYIYKNAKYSKDFLVLHGSAIEYDNHAYLFLAATLAGKTTLASYLTSHNMGYITDDFIILNRKTLNIHPYITPLHLRKDSTEILKKYNCLLSNNLHFYEEIQRYIYSPTNCVTEIIPIGKIYFITRTEQENMASEITMTEKIASLLKSPIKNYTIDSKHLKLITRLAREYKSLALKYYDMSYVKDVIENGL